MIFDNVFRESRQFWGNLAARDRRIVLGFAVAVVVVFVGLMFLVTLQEPYETAINIEASRTADVRRALAKAGVEAEYPSAGVVTVRPSQADQARWAIAQVMTLPIQQQGMERFDRETFGQTKEVRDAQLLLAREVQLERMLENIPRITYAIVKLTPAEKRLLANQSTDAAASIMVTVSEDFTQDQVRAIENLVMGFVPGLKHENIAIVDQNSNQLNRARTGTAEDQIRNIQMGLVAGEEFKLETAARKLLEPYVGRDNFRVSAFVEMDFKDLSREVQEYGAEGRPTEEQTSTRSRTTTLPSGGQPGANSNVADANVTTGPGVGTPSTENDEETITRTVYDTTKELSKQNLAQVLKKTLAVTVDTTALRRMAKERMPAGAVASATAASATGEDPATEALLTDMREALSTGIGLRPSRDLLTIVHLPLDRTPELARQQYAKQLWWQNMIQTWGTVAGIVLVGAFVIAAFRYLRKRKLVEITAPIEEMERVVAEPKRELSLYELGIQDMSDISSLPPEEQRRVLLRREVEEFAMKRKEEAAQIIKGWLSEGE